MTTAVTVLPAAEQVSTLAAFATDQVQQTADKLRQRMPELAEEPLSAEAELILSVPEALGKAVNHYASLLLDALDGPAADPRCPGVRSVEAAKFSSVYGNQRQRDE